MGNQGTAEDGFREGVELHPLRRARADQGDPRLDQPADLAAGHRAGSRRRPAFPTTFAGTNSSAPRRDRPYHPDYQPFNWRGWLDFGTGALGDMACHTINVACMALELFDPESVEVLDTSGIVDRETYPVWSIIRTQFGQRNGRGPLSLTWYDGGDKLPEDKRAYKEMLYGEKVPDSGLLLVGEKGSFFSQNDYGAEHVLLPREKFKDFQKPKPTLPRSPGHFTEWVEAIKAERAHPRRCRTSTTPAA